MNTIFAQRIKAVSILLLLLATPALALAHALGQSYLFLKVGEQSVSGRLEIPTADLGKALELDENGDGEVTAEEVSGAEGRIEAYLQDRFRILDDAGVSLPITYQDFDTLEIEVATYLVARFTVQPGAGVPDVLNIEYSAITHIDSDHRGWLIVEENAKTGLAGNHATVSLIFGPHSQRQDLDLLVDPTPATWRKFIWEGMWHIWIGLDHVLFLIALMLSAVVYRKDGLLKPVARFSSAFTNVVKIVTLFTIGHSITLALSVLGLVTIPSRAVESVIAFSVFIVAVNNVYPIVKKHVWWFVFAFGLFHGLGFASVLSELMLGQVSKTKSLIGFNLGVEMGQIAIVLVVFPVLFAIRNSKFYVPGIVTVGSALIAVVALWWSVERAVGM